jgi:hypothetical protein
LELVEIQFEHVKIPEQNLSTYFFYKSFIKDNLLSFDILLSKYFDSNSDRFKDCVIPANNTFGVKNVMDKLLPFLQNHWKEIKSNEDKAFKFLSTFWYYLQTETLEFIYNIIQELPSVTQSNYGVSYENNAFSYSQNQVIELLGEFLRFPNNLKDVIELGFEYSRKKPRHLPEWIHKIREYLTFDRDDQTRYGFTRQTVLYQILLNGLSLDDKLISTVFYELSKTFLSFTFNHTKSGRNHTIYWYDYPIPNIPPIHNFRQNIWKAIEQNFEKNQTESFDLLLSYSSVRPDVTKEIMEFDIPFIVDIINKHLSEKSFEHCKYVHDQIRWCNRNSISHHSFKTLAHKFTNPTYEIFLKIDWDRLRDKEMYEFDDYSEYEKLKEAEIRNSFVFKNANEVKEFYNIFTFLKKIAKNEWNYNTTLDHVIDENCSKHFDLGCLLLTEVIVRDNEVNYIPRVVFRNHLKQVKEVNIIWGILQKHEFVNKGLWELSFYDYIDDSLLTEDYVQALIKTVSSMKEANTIHFDRLQRFLNIEPNLFQIILRTIVEKNEKEGTRLQVWMDSFSSHFEQLGDDLELIKKAYLQQNKIYNHFDYEGKGFLKILKKDSGFLIDYVNSLYSDEQSRLSVDHRNLSFIWQVENIERVLRKSL